MSEPEDLTRMASAPPSDTAAAVIPPDEATRVLSPADARASSKTSEAWAGAGTAVLSPGTRIAEFEITRLVGQGGFGVVYEAWDHTLERVVALKEYLPSTLAQRAADGAIIALSESKRETFELGMRSFTNEARLLAQFDHPSLVKVYRFWQERGTTYMVMPYYQGRTLRQALITDGAGGVDEAWLLGIVDGVTQALAVMHAAQCYHRDIAPDNILLLEGSDRPVVLDFGAARRVITDKTQAITVILKPGYAPIEQYAEMPDMKQGAWTDIYALAAVMHVAVTTRVPPPSVGRILSDSYAPLLQDPMLAPRFSAALLGAIDAGLAVRPEARPQSMEAFRALLGLHNVSTGSEATLLVAAGAAVPRAPSVRTAEPATKPRSAVFWASGLMLVLLTATGLWWVWAGYGSVPTISERTVEAPAQSTAGGTAGATATDSPALVEVVTPPPSLPERSPLESLQALALGAAPDFQVLAKPHKPAVTIGKDRLGFEINSKRSGFAYVFLLDSQGDLYMLFPNALDKRNQVTANQPFELPRASWPMEAGGPAGVDHFAVVVSTLERDFSQSGFLARGVFAQFPASVLAALERARGAGPTPLLGKAICPNDSSQCADVYGVAHFEIIEK